MSTEGSKYVNKEIKNALKEVKQIKTLIEQSNEERKSLLSSLEEAKKKKEVRKSQVPPPPTLCAGGRDWLSLLWMACQVVSQVAMATHSPSRRCQLILGLWLTNREGLFAFESFKG